MNSIMELEYKYLMPWLFDIMDNHYLKIIRIQNIKIVGKIEYLEIPRFFSSLKSITSLVACFIRTNLEFTVLGTRL